MTGFASMTPEALMAEATALVAVLRSERRRVGDYHAALTAAPALITALVAELRAERAKREEAEEDIESILDARGGAGIEQAVNDAGLRWSTRRLPSP